MKPRRVEPRDSRYGWVVVVSAFFTMGLTAAVLKNFGHFFLDIQSHFAVQASTTSWVTSTTIAIAIFMLSARVVIMLGGLLATLGMLLASLDLSLPWLYLTMGILQGTGLSFAWISANSLVSHYFVRWRPIAFAIASSGECVFVVIFSPFFKWLIETYTWQGALLIIGGLQLNLCVCGALMRPLERTPSPAQETKDNVEGDVAALPPKKRTFFQCSLMKKPEFFLYILFAIFSAAGFFIPPLFLVPFASSLGMDNYWPAMLLSVLALADLAGRLICGWIANMRLVRNLQLLTIVATLLGVVLLLLPVSQNYWAVLVFASLFGFLFGCVVAIHVTAIVDIVTLQGFDSGLGLFMLLRSIGGFAGPPAAGWLVDHTNNYSAAFYLSGVCLIASAAFVVLVDRLVQRRKKAAESKVYCEINQQEKEEEEGWETAKVKSDTVAQVANTDIS
uniref:Zgc:114041 n=1 Tax=Amphilophus citrinellus TaxID=61819 RepID=A0A3Q0TGX9_AMPCI